MATYGQTPVDDSLQHDDRSVISLLRGLASFSYQSDDVSRSRAAGAFGNPSLRGCWTTALNQHDWSMKLHA